MLYCPAMSDAPSQPLDSSFHFDLDTVREIAQLLRESELGEICIETTDDDAPAARLLIRRGGSTLAAVAPVYAPQVGPALESLDETEAASTPAGQPTREIASPAVGVFRPAPKGAVKEGDTVKAGQTVACVESMRVPNEVVSKFAGRVLELRAMEGQGVEYGQVLFVIEETP